MSAMANVSAVYNNVYQHEINNIDIENWNTINYLVCLFGITFYINYLLDDSESINN